MQAVVSSDDTKFQMTVFFIPDSTTRGVLRGELKIPALHE
jgi:hypothetical protein